MPTTYPDDFNLFFEILRALEKLQAPYAIIGAFGASFFGISRATADIDIVVHLSEAHIQGLTAEFPLPRYYADPEQMRNYIRHGVMFNIIDTTEGRKADLLPVTMNPYYRFVVMNRVRQKLDLPDGSQMDIWCARPVDIIIGKLQAWTEGRSRKHETDIYELLVFHNLGANPDIPLDEAEVEAIAVELGPITLSFWQAVTRAARDEAMRIQQTPMPLRK